MKLRQYSVAVAVLLLLGACAQLGIVPAESFNQRVAYGYGTVTSVRNVAANMVRSKHMSPQEGRQVLSVTDSARAYLDRAAKSGPTKGGLAELQFANELLLEVQKLLEARKRAARGAKS